MFSISRDEYAQAVAAARTKLGKGAFTTALAERQQMTPQQRWQQ